MSVFLDKGKWVDQNHWAVALRDAYPVSPGHTLIVPKRLVVTVFDLNTDEIAGCWNLLQLQKDLLREIYAPAGFNIGMNCGEAAGQTVMHAHIHLIPRYAGDHPNPRGGVRAVIPGKADYKPR